MSQHIKYPVTSCFSSLQVNGANGERVPRFVALDSDAAKGSSHPPMFAAIMRRTKGVKVQYHAPHLRCYRRQTKLWEVNVFSRVCHSVSRVPLYRAPVTPHPIEDPSLDMFIFIQIGPHCKWPVQTCSLCSTCFWKAGGWHSTERPSCFLLFFHFLSFCLFPSFSQKFLLMLHVNTPVLDFGFIDSETGVILFTCMLLCFF